MNQIGVIVILFPHASVHITRPMFEPDVTFLFYALLDIFSFYSMRLRYNYTKTIRLPALIFYELRLVNYLQKLGLVV